MLRTIMLAVLTSALVASGQIMSAADDTPHEKDLQDLAAARLARHGVPAFSVAIVVNGRIRVAAAGEADPEAGIPATPDTLFQAASVSKLITATLVMRQVERGKLALDASANRYLAPDRWIRNGAGEPVAATIRQLLTHTAGLPVRWIPGKDTTPMSEKLVGSLRTVRPPGEKIIYSNQGYALLGYLAAAADGQSFDEHARTVLFEPIGMERSSFRPTREFEADLPAGYGKLFGALGGRVERSDPSAFAPAAALITTAKDLARFALLLLRGGELDGKRLLRSETIDEMLRVHARQHPTLDEGYGLGFMVRERNGQVLAWHDGGMPGVSARFALAPDRGIAAIALANSVAADAPVGFVADALALMGRPESLAAHERADADQLETAAGAYRLVDMLPDERWYLNALFNLVLDLKTVRPVLRRFPLLEPLDVEPLGSERFLVHGWLLDGAIAHVEGDRLYVGILEARRVAIWESARALLAYGVVLTLGGLLVLLVLIRRLLT